MTSEDIKHQLIVIGEDLILCPPVTSSVKNLSRVWAPLVRIGFDQGLEDVAEVVENHVRSIEQLAERSIPAKVWPFQNETRVESVYQTFYSKAKRR